MSFEDLLGILAGFVGLPAIILSLLARSRRVTVRLEQQGLLADAPHHHMAVGGGLTHQRFLLVAALLVGFSLLGLLVALHSYFT
ncbi:hypothetical protein COCOR_02917 [Corallococcus coralloides DSM 2259]|uniref:Uncharacterized protein n=1 Tax=Corallococcus coralloides (strain ATCC 25202 / DSM 2259 / NBRC 100086 / M2) TaxID=1144275 RepID=H8MYQ8_CORCM|nr:hypothetical protein [Corallococcus coralloides]AFE04917.1 hypothetical protein COCOR_02917 [Corallococcus coralloides DSM 2259]